MKGISFHYECYLSVLISCDSWFQKFENIQLIQKIFMIVRLGWLLQRENRGSSIVRVNIRFLYIQGKGILQRLWQQIIVKVKHEQGSTTTRLRTFHLRHFVYRRFVYDSIPASSTVIHPTSVSAIHYFHQFQLLLTL